LLPPVWGRFSTLRQEFDTSRGGRIVMWTRIAPPLVKAHPFGIGYRALTEELMLEVAAKEGIHVEGGRNHLHSNPVQVLVALGWLGLAVYLVWMAGGIVSATRLIRALPRGSPERSMALALLLMLGGLFLNGLVEYNLSDGELVIFYGVILGMMGSRRCYDT
jgi:O-antigen ligase